MNRVRWGCYCVACNHWRCSKTQVLKQVWLCQTAVQHHSLDKAAFFHLPVAPSANIRPPSHLQSRFPALKKVFDGIYTSCMHTTSSNFTTCRWHCWIEECTSLLCSGIPIGGWTVLIYGRVKKFGLMRWEGGEKAVFGLAPIACTKLCHLCLNLAKFC